MVLYLDYKQNDKMVKIPVSVGFYALKRFEMEKKMKFSDIDADDMQSIEPLFWYSMEAGYKKEKKDNPFERHDCELMIDDLLYKFIEIIPLFFPGEQIEETRPNKKGGKKAVK